MLKYFFILFWFVFISCYSQQDYNFNKFVDDSESLIKSPIKWNAKDFVKLGLVAGVTYGLMEFDDETKSFLYNNRKINYPLIMEFGRIYGEPYTFPILGGLLMLHGGLKDNKANTKLGFEIIESGIYSGATVFALKFAFGRSRPQITNNPKIFDPFVFGGFDKRSFPSGHTALAFSLSTVLSKNTDNTLLKVSYYFPAVLTGISRIYHNKHWLSDVFLGAIIGIYMGNYFTELHSEELDKNGIYRPENHSINLKIIL